MKDSQPPGLLPAVVDLEAATADSLRATLQAVRRRRQHRRIQRIASSLAVVAAVVIPAVIWLRNDSSRAPEQVPAAMDIAQQGESTPATAPASTPELRSPGVERIPTEPLAADNRLTASNDADTPVPVERIDDDELLALAGGRGVGLARLPDGTPVLLIAGRPAVVSE